MEVQTLKRGRLIDHIQLVVRDLDASRKFYGAIFDELGIECVDQEDFFYGDELVVSTADSEAAEGHLTGRVHVAFQAADRDQVKTVYEAALAAGGRDHGGPGVRKKYHAGYYAAFMLDPDGNNIEIVYHGEAERSAASVDISFKQ